MLLTMMVLPGKAVGQTRAEVVHYTLDGTITASGSAYATASTLTQNGIGWSVMGNTEQNPWRIGGKSITNEDRPIKSTTAMSSAITKIEVSVGATASSLTVNSIKLIVASDASFNTQLDEITATSGLTQTTLTFTPTSGTEWATNAYYNIVFNVTRTSSSGNGYVTFNNAKFYKTSGSPTTYTVTYDCNGGTSNCPDNATGITENTTIHLASAPSKTGHSFGGWNDGTTTHAAGAEYTVTGNVTMTAQWTPDPHTITYKAGEGTGSDVVVNKNYDESYEIAAVPSTFTAPAGKPNFTGWNTVANGTGTPYSPGQNITVSGDLILFAQWSNSVTATYTVDTKTSVTTSGVTPEGSSATFINTYDNNKYQITKDKSMTLTLSGYEGHIIKGITLSMHSNNSSGAGSLSVVGGTTTLASISDANFNDDSWYGAWSNPTFVDVTPTMSNSNYVVKQGEDVVIVIAASVNSLFCQSFEIEYEASNDPKVLVTPTSREVTYTAHNSNTESLNFTVSSENIDSPTYQFTYCDAEGTVLNTNPYSSWFSATLSGSTVSFTTSQNSGNDRTAYFKVYAEVNSEPVYSGLCSVTQLHKPTTYTLVTSTNQLVTGKHYILASEQTAGEAYAMGGQSGSIRTAVPVTITNNDNIISIEETANISELVLSGSSTDSWTLYDQNTSGYLYSSSSSNNNIGTRDANSDGDSQWQITFYADSTVFASQSTTTDRNIIRYNYNNGTPRFSCYKLKSSLKKCVFLYVKDGDNDCHIYSNTTLNDDMTVTGSMNIHSGVVTVASNKTLTVDGTLTNNTASNLVLNNGGQLISNSVAATVHKTIAAWATNTGWYLLSSPIHNAAISGDSPTISNLITSSGYDLFRYNESKSTNQWENYKNEEYASDFTSFERGRGYLYRNAATQDVTFTGSTNTSVTYYLSYANAAGDLKGFNIIGNPFTHDITWDDITLSNVNEVGYYTLGKDGGWTVHTEASGDLNTNKIAPMQGFLVQAEDANPSVTFGAAKKNNENKANNDYIKFVVNYGKYNDVTYALFDKGDGINKIDHRNAEIPMLYISQDGKNYAIATMGDDTQMFDLSFEAKTMGTYTISMNAKGNFSYIHLIDRLTGDDTNLLIEDYSFIGSPQDNAERFIVKLSYDNGSSTGSETFAYQSGNEIIVNGEGTLEVYDVTGRKVMTTTINGVETINGLNSGVYVFRVIGETLKTQKIVVR